MYFVFFSRYQVQIASWLRMGLCIHCPSSRLWFCLFWTCTGFIYVWCLSWFLSSYYLQPSCVWKMLFSWSHSPGLDLTVLHKSKPRAVTGLLTSLTHMPTVALDSAFLSSLCYCLAFEEYLYYFTICVLCYFSFCNKRSRTCKYVPTDVSLRLLMTLLCLWETSNDSCWRLSVLTALLWRTNSIVRTAFPRTLPQIRVLGSIPEALEPAVSSTVPHFTFISMVDLFFHLGFLEIINLE